MTHSTTAEAGVVAHAIERPCWSAKAFSRGVDGPSREGESPTTLMTATRCMRRSVSASLAAGNGGRDGSFDGVLPEAPLVVGIERAKQPVP